MNYMGGPRKQSRMVANYDDPWVSVGLLAQTVFCQRAGIIHREMPQDIEEEVFHAGRGMRATFYSFHQLWRSIKKTIISIIAEILFLLAYIILSPFINHVLSDNLGVQLVLLFLFFVVCFFLLASTIRLLYLFLVCLAAKARSPFVPNPHSSEAQPIHWWSLLNAGFQPIKPQDIYRDEQWHLTGCPWRILVKGNVRIPVFKKRYSDDVSGKMLYRQHYARMAAYCHLIEKSEHAESPYGIILYGNTHKGVTVPYQPRNKKTFHAGLLETRETMSTLQRAPYFMPQVPSNLNKCVNCPHSRRDRLTGASPCGMRFGWIPPNNRDGYFFLYR